MFVLSEFTSVRDRCTPIPITHLHVSSPLQCVWHVQHASVSSDVLWRWPKHLHRLHLHRQRLPLNLSRDADEKLHTVTARVSVRVATE